MKCIIVGNGRMGQRYVQVLQALVGDELKLTVVDPHSQPDFDCAYFKTLEEVEGPFDLAVDAHPNMGRLDLFKKLQAKGCEKFVIEKPHAQSLGESKAMLEFAKLHSLKVMLPFFKRFEVCLAPQLFADFGAGPLLAVTATSGAIGLGCNGIHTIDWINTLFSETPHSVYADLQEDSIESPRGKDFKDSGGVMILNYSKGRRGTLNVLPNSSHGTSVTLSFERGKVVIDEQQGMDWRWYKQGDQSLPFYRTHMDQVQEPPMAYAPNLIEMMKVGLGQLVAGDVNGLPGLQEGHELLKVFAWAALSTRERRVIDASEDEANLNFEFKFT